jgi:PAS domain S-box-containing protein
MDTEYHNLSASCGCDDDPLRMVLEGTATVTGERFFEALVENLAQALHTKCAWITEYHEDLRRLKALAFWVDGELIPDFEVDIDDTPCEAVIEKAQLVHYPDKIRELFPRSEKLKELDAESYMGVPLADLNGRIFGHLAVIDNRPMTQEAKSLTLFKIFAARAATELQRIKAEAEIRAREEKLLRLVDSAMDAIVELDQNFHIVRLNPSAKMVFNLAPKEDGSGDFQRFLTAESHKKISSLVEVLDARPAGRKYLWVPGGLRAVTAAGEEFAAEATLSQFEMQHRNYYTLIFRNVNDRIEAEKKIRLLSEEAAYLKEEIRALENFDEIVGRSRPLSAALDSAVQVAATNTTVLILGETGTGKELIARAIHRSSNRSHKPFIKLNCAALPVNLVESELFGHEPGAFTGADRQRKGRFELANGGTIFLDEVGELPMEVQAKLLRVLQEGQFERLGGTQARTVSARVLAASNRDLSEEVLAGRFRADLFYRLNVYPITVPPLRDRRGDIPLLVEYFVSRIAPRIGKVIERIPTKTINQLNAYHWPGNVRELKNIVERAIITSPAGELRLPEPLGEPKSGLATTDRKNDFDSLETLERRHISTVLQTTGWRISGPKGAAKILNLNPSTLRYRIKKLGLSSPW